MEQLVEDEGAPLFNKGHLNFEWTSGTSMQDDEIDEDEEFLEIDASDHEEIDSDDDSDDDRTEEEEFDEHESEDEHINDFQNIGDIALDDDDQTIIDVEEEMENHDENELLEVIIEDEDENHEHAIGDGATSMFHESKMMINKTTPKQGA